MSVILDFGSSSFKLGHSSQEKPSLIIPSFYENGANDYVPGENIGQDGQIIQAVKNCEIVNQDRILSILSATIDDLAGNDDDLNIALTDNPTASEKNTVFFSQLFFEDTEASAVCIKPSCLAVADNLKIETGLILDIGHEKSYAYPREHCFIPAHAIKSTFFGGSIIDDYEIALLSYKSPLNWKEYQRIENIKHDMIVSPFRLTDEELEQLNPIQMLEKSGPELLFDKEYLDLTFSGDYPPPKVNRLYEECTIPELIASSISACDIGLRRELWEQI